MRKLVLLALSTSVLLFSASALAADFVVTDPSFAWMVAPLPGENPTLTLTRGKTYTFQIDTAGSGSIHLFQITDEGDGQLSEVTNQGTSNGIMTFTVKSSTPTPLFYSCEAHSFERGQINIVNAPSVPAMGSASLTLLACALLGAGALVYRRTPTAR